MTQKYRTLEGKNRTLGGEGGVKNHQKLSDIIYVRSLTTGSFNEFQEILQGCNLQVRKFKFFRARDNFIGDSLHFIINIEDK